MKLTRASSYALHAVVYMAQQKNEKKPVASHHIAHARGIPERFLLKVLKPLVNARVLRSVKGPNGGYELARDPADITVLEIIEAVEQGPISGQAPLPEKEDAKKYPNYKPEYNMPVYKKLDSLCQATAEAMRENLKRVRVSDLVAGKKDAGETRRKTTKAKDGD